MARAVLGAAQGLAQGKRTETDLTFFRIAAMQAAAETKMKLFDSAGKA